MSNPLNLDPSVTYQIAVAARADTWLPGCGGTEVPFTTRTKRRLLYCWNPSNGHHAYLDCETDLILSDAEAIAALATH
jgi:hypothetical protein